MSARLRSLLLALLCSPFHAQWSAAQLVSTGQTVVIRDIPYYVPAKPITTVSSGGLRRLGTCGSLVPVTVINSSASIQSTIKGFAGSDDVWSEAFLDGM